MSATKKINGKIYKLFEWYTTKTEAKAAAKKQKDKGKKARIVKTLADRRYVRYAVYVRGGK
jgi:hypothetical protein